jgi:hypothetical protein
MSSRRNSMRCAELLFSLTRSEVEIVLRVTSSFGILPIRSKQGIRVS